MKSKVIIAALLGGITSFLVGFLTYNLALSEFFKTNVTMNVGTREQIELWSLFASNLVYGFFLTIIFDRWASISTFKTGMTAGMWMGFLLGLARSLMNYSMMNNETIIGHVVEVILWIVIVGMAGGVAGWVLGYGNKSSE